MISETQRALGYRTAFVPELRPALRVADALAIELAVTASMFPSDAGTGRATLLGGGLRFDPSLTTNLSFFADAHAGAGLTGDNERFMFDAGLGLEYAISPSIAFGPYVRYGQVVDELRDPRFVTGGVLLALRWPEEERRPPEEPPPRVVRSVAPPPRPPVAIAPPPAPPAVADADGDGVRDSQDLCPAEHRGPTPDPQRTGCPDGDDDKDGVPNGLDRCRDQALGLHPNPVAMGCPLPDRDADAVPDLNDTCPDQAGAPDPDVRKNGCPGLVRVERGFIKILKPIVFATNRDTILPASFPVLRSVADSLLATPGIKKVSIEGHTDGQGQPEKNLELSRRRAESILRWLMEHGVESGRLQAKGFGDERPLATNKTARGRAENRRVELVIIDPAPEGGTQP